MTSAHASIIYRYDFSAYNQGVYKIQIIYRDYAVLMLHRYIQAYIKTKHLLNAKAEPSMRHAGFLPKINIYIYNFKHTKRVYIKYKSYTVIMLCSCSIYIYLYTQSIQAYMKTKHFTECQG